MEVCAAVRVGGRAHDELVVEDERRHMLHDVAHDLSAEDRHSLAGKLLIGLRGEYQALRGNGGNGVEVPVTHALNSWGKHVASMGVDVGACDCVCALMFQSASLRHRNPLLPAERP